MGAAGAAIAQPSRSAHARRRWQGRNPWRRRCRWISTKCCDLLTDRLAIAATPAVVSAWEAQPCAASQLACVTYNIWYHERPTVHHGMPGTSPASVRRSKLARRHGTQRLIAKQAALMSFVYSSSFPIMALLHAVLGHIAGNDDCPRDLKEEFTTIRVTGCSRPPSARGLASPRSWNDTPAQSIQRWKASFK